MRCSRWRTGLVNRSPDTDRRGPNHPGYAGALERITAATEPVATAESIAEQDEAEQQVVARREVAVHRRPHDTGLDSHLGHSDLGVTAALDATASRVQNATLRVVGRAADRTRTGQERMGIKDIGRLLGADEGLNHQIVDTFATLAQSDLAWTEKIWASLARTDGSLQVDFGLGKYHNRGIIDGFGGVSRGRSSGRCAAVASCTRHPRRRPSGRSSTRSSNPEARCASGSSPMTCSRSRSTSCSRA